VTLTVNLQLQANALIEEASRSLLREGFVCNPSVTHCGEVHPTANLLQNKIADN
jgi:hypothetical protein